MCALQGQLHTSLRCYAVALAGRMMGVVRVTQGDALGYVQLGFQPVPRISCG